ncbi:S8 family peptidase [Flavobacterium amniphilum]|uniref:S8 family peptidase n=1 Tax=Flavobacterium amniphilum TaxID=1834035 RepID=UPI00202A150A|nr:S8 family peptidase [Flavobacterium amniphilum]MCL9805030.1 S8 family peptidase [Flavobacterium amniphilum]
MKLNSLYTILITLLIYSCSSNKISKTSLKDDLSKNWHHEDYTVSNVPGISLEKAVVNLKGLKPQKQIIVATIDNLIDSNHEDLKDNIWINEKEIPGNKIDDDHNGYVDDVKGWNFLGTKSGNYIVWGNFEYTRVIREYEPLFKDKKEEEIFGEDLKKYKEYKRALIFQEEKYKYYANYLKSMIFCVKIEPKAKDTLKSIFPREDYTVKQLDSLFNKYKTSDKTFRQRRDSGDEDFSTLVLFMKISMEMKKEGGEKLKDELAQTDSITNKNLNVNYNERLWVDNGRAVLEKGYGNGNITPKIKGIRTNYAHNTKVSSIIAANRNNNIGIKGFSDNIKIMPLSVSPSGDEHDKDIANAIYYSVDNGAKVINMSFAKEFSLHPEWVTAALQYAEKHNVLVVHAASNESKNNDTNPLYPNDYLYDDKPEVSNNFISVGSINKNYGEKMVSSFSNYGKVNVDLFAPGEDIYTAIPENKYSFDSGTSLAAPMVSGAAALIWLYYPKLSVQQVKKIILESGTPYDLEVIVPGTKDKKVKFSELSKTGKVLNVYNAMQMAKEMSKQKS